MLIGGHIEPIIELSGPSFLFKSLVLPGIQLLAKAVGNIIIVLEDSTLLHVLDEGLQMVCLQSVVPFLLRNLPAILPFVATWRPGTPHDTINIPPDLGLSGSLLSVNLRIAIGENPLGDR